MQHRNRREILKSLGGAAAFAGMGLGFGKRLMAQSCSLVPSPALTEGPYFVEEILNRSDITVDPTDGSVQPGLPLNLNINLKQITNCALVPLTGVYVDIWHCNAAGVYSDQAANNSSGKKFLRGYQSTDRNGAVRFQTIFPGWYQGRAVHIHAKVRIFNGPTSTYEFTTQFFFDEDLTDKIYLNNAPYSQRPKRDTLNTTDGIYTGASLLGSVQSNSGSLLMLQMDSSDSSANASIDLIVDESLGSSPSGNGGAGGPGAPGAPGGPGGPGGPPPRG
jgi:protocatechuate 3,4-dioxygenase beta subunit